MTASTRSVYPASVEDLLPSVRAHVDELGEVPSRNQIMKRFKVGGPKASAILAALTDPATGVESATPESDTKRVRTLRPVGETETGTATGVVPGELRTAQTPEPGDGEPGDTSVDDPVTGDLSQATPVVDPDTAPVAQPVRVRRWPLVLLALPAFVAIWGGWVGLGRMTGFGPIQLLPGIWDSLVVNSAITLPIGVEAYAAFAMSVWLSGRTRAERTRRFAMWSALGSLGLGMAGQVAYHLMSAAGITVAPWLITTFVACLPVVVLGCGAALLHLMHEEGDNR